MSSEKSKITSLGVLRGIAVAAVCFCHFGKPLSAGSVMPDFFGLLGKYGEYGVQIFFVISGFVIPYSLSRGNYQLRDYPVFLWKRILRLHPPYLISLLLTLILSYLSYRSRHMVFPETAVSIVKSFFYIHAPVGNPVYWTLKVEAQYYLFIGLFFVLLSRYQKASIWLGMPILLCCGRWFVGDYIIFFNFLVFFFIGIMGYIIYVKKEQSFLDHMAIVGLIAFSWVYYDLAATLSAAMTVAIILFYRRPMKKWAEYTGEISYSLYLIHFPVGIKLINLLQRKVSGSWNWLLFIIATIICYGLAIILYHVVETKATQWSNRFKYRSKREIALEQNK